MSPKAKSEAWAARESSEQPLGCSSVASSPSSGVDSGLPSPANSSDEEQENEAPSAEDPPQNRCLFSSRSLVDEKNPSRISRKVSPYAKQCGVPKTQSPKPELVDLLEKVANSPKEAERMHLRLIASIMTVLSVDKFSDFECVSEARKLLEVTIKLTESFLLHHLLRVFSHSISCHDDKCVKPCLMFRRIRGHLVKVDHKCALVHVYSHLTRMHVDTCVAEKCGLPTCKGLQAYRERESNQVLPRNFRDIEQKLALALGKPPQITAKNAVPPVKPENTEENKENLKEEANCKPIENKTLSHLKLSENTAVMTKEVEEAMDLSQRVSKLEMRSTSTEERVED
ncbi:uncharacterized protein LOC108668946 [Hyalella azteca]|uniref:Uncharacterized protein LOC108668946 n=1 Tax=Hyalella azteca TaxID=294128 RepID=A0A8B7NDM9_HYAAZ|nr:uncharacterized protein LOC108668946 [Hyalella azteca]